jgi:hypothetical protein
VPQTASFKEETYYASPGANPLKTFWSYFPVYPLHMYGKETCKPILKNWAKLLKMQDTTGHKHVGV